MFDPQSNFKDGLVTGLLIALGLAATVYTIHSLFTGRYTP